MVQINIISHREIEKGAQIKNTELGRSRDHREEIRNTEVRRSTDQIEKEMPPINPLICSQMVSPKPPSLGAGALRTSIALEARFP